MGEGWSMESINQPARGVHNIINCVTAILAAKMENKQNNNNNNKAQHQRSKQHRAPFFMLCATITAGSAIFTSNNHLRSSSLSPPQMQSSHHSRPLRKKNRNNQTTTNSTTNNNNDILLDCTHKKNRNTTRVAISEFYSRNCAHDLTSKVVFFHVGKAGGGTCMIHWYQNHLRLWPVHPNPHKGVIGALQSTEDGTPTTLAINIRDPVDRFISAFQWRLVRLCAPDDEREPSSEGGAQKADEMCLSSSKTKKEAFILRETYQSNPNVLAEALCEHNSETRPRALEDIAKIGHSLSLAKWLDFLISNDDYNATTVGVNDFMALPLEKQSGAKEALFEQHIDQLAVSLTHTHFGRDVAHRLEQKLERKLLNTPQNSKGSKAAEKMMHSSSTYTNQTKPPPLTPLGECCLTRYFEDDYRLIQSMLLPSSSLSSHETENDEMIIEPMKNAHPILAKACSWGNEAQQKLCRLDLQSMLLRRSKYLNLSRGSCAKIVSNSQ